jgi:hypothetical protein
LHLLGVLRLNNGLAQVGVDGRTMSSSNAAVQQPQQDVIYLALELNLYISISIGIGTGLDVKKCPTWTPSRTVSTNLKTCNLKNLNSTGKIKVIVIGLLSLPNLLMPTRFDGVDGFAMVLIPLLLTIIIIPVIAKLNESVLGRKISKPDWNDNPLTRKQPLVSFHFAAFFFLAVGFSMLIGNMIRFQALSYLGLTCISVGLGALVGILLAVKWAK